METVRAGASVVRGLVRCGLAAPIELKSKRLAEGGQRPFGGIGLGDLEGDVVHLAR